MEIEEKLRNLLLPVFGLNSTDEVQPEHSLINDLGADSIDFVEIIYLIEREFGVIIKTNEIMIGGANINSNDLFVEGQLTEQGAIFLNKNFPESSSDFKTGMTRIDLFCSLTVRDLANIIKKKKTG